MKNLLQTTFTIHKTTTALEQIFDLILHTEEFITAMVAENPLKTYIVLFLIIFSETGLVIFPFFPGDALLITVGLITINGALSIWIIVPLLIIAAILGNTSNYYIGKFAGSRLMKVRSKIFKRYLDRTSDFYAKHGNKAVLYSRFFPIFRTYVPFVAGITRMDWKSFMLYNVVGGSVWVIIFVWGIYMLGEIPFVKDNFEKIFLFIMFLTIVPFLSKFISGLWRRWQKPADK